MKRITLALLFTSACSGISPTAPTQTDTPQTHVETAPAPAPQAAVVPQVSVEGPATGCQPATEAVKWVVRVQATELVRLYPHAFRSQTAGCENTTEELTVMDVEGLRHYASGQSGETVFSYGADPKACGRVEMGVIWKNADGQDTMLGWRVIDSGRDCPKPPPPPPPPATPPATPPACPGCTPTPTCPVGGCAPPPPPPPPVCPVVTVSNWKNYVSAASVVKTQASAVAEFTVTLPQGCTIPLSVVSYQIDKCPSKFPQRFIDGSQPSAGKAYVTGVYTNQMRVERVEHRYQVDLRFEGYTPGEALTQANENAYYKVRTIAWIVDKSCD